MNYRKMYGPGDMVWAYRKPYHGTDERVCTTKLVRPFLILSEIDNEFLVLPMTTKGKYNSVEYKNSFIITDDLYIIERKDIVNYHGYCDIYKDLIKEVYELLDSTYNVAPRKIKKWLLIEFNKYYVLEKEYKVGDIIKTFNAHQNYIVDSVKKDGIYGFKVYHDDKIDFSKSEYVANNEIYKVEKNIDIKSYLKKRNEAYEEFNKSVKVQNEVAKNNEKKKNNFHICIGSIIKIEETPLFVIYSNKNYLVCIPYNNDYRLSGIIKVKKDKERITFIKNLSSIEILPILKELSKNIHVIQDISIQNYITEYQFEHESKVFNI